MRRMSITLVAVAAIYMLAVAAGITQANQFIAKTGEIEEGEFKISSACQEDENPQLFKIADMEIVCGRSRVQEER